MITNEFDKACMISVPFQPSRRDSHCLLCPHHPPLKRWAIFILSLRDKIGKTSLNLNAYGATLRGCPVSFLLPVFFSLLVLMPGGMLWAKSLYLIANIDADPTPIRTYDLQGAPVYIEFQAEQGVPNHASGAVGLAVDGRNKKLFVTYENGNQIQVMDAVYFRDLGTAIAFKAMDLAGIAFDQGRNRVYTLERGTNRLYVYDWNNSTNSLALVSGSPFVLAHVSSAFGLALDENRGRLFVADADSTAVYYFSTANWQPQGSFVLAYSRQAPVGIAVDSQRNYVFMGNAVNGRGLLVKYDLNTSTETFYTLPAAGGGDQVVGVATDEDTGYVYVTTGNTNGGGTGSLLVFDSNLNVLRNNLGRIGHPTGIAVPRAQVSYNPLNFSKTSPAGALPNSILEYNLCFDNLGYGRPVTGLVITDSLPPGLLFASASHGGINQSGTVTWNLGNLAIGTQPACVRLTGTVTAVSGSLQNSATIRSNETPPTTQSSTTLIGSSISTTVSSTTTTTLSGTTSSVPSTEALITLDCPSNVVPGSMVTIPVRLSAPSAPGVASFQMDLQYNRLQLVFIGAQRGPALLSAGKDVLVEASNPGTVSLLVLGGNQSVIPGGVAVNITFQVNPSSPAGGSLPISCANLHASDPYAQAVPMVCAGNGCSIRVVSKCGCDANQDGLILVTDCQLLINMLLGAVPATCDVNGDGLVDIRDLQIIINAILDPQHRCLN